MMLLKNFHSIANNLAQNSNKMKNLLIFGIFAGIFLIISADHNSDDLIDPVQRRSRQTGNEPLYAEANNNDNSELRSRRDSGSTKKPLVVVPQIVLDVRGDTTDKGDTPNKGRGHRGHENKGSNKRIKPRSI